MIIKRDPFYASQVSFRNLQLLLAKENQDWKDRIKWELIAEKDLFDLLPGSVVRPNK